MNRDLQSRKCSHCGHNGHNSRTCHGKGVFKLFGVKINLGGDEKEYLDESSSSMTMIRKRNECECMRKSKSMDNLVQACNYEHDHDAAGYLSDGLIHAKFDRATASHERKKGLPWTEDEHRSFLIGLKKLGKGDWKGISKNYVPTKTSTQVASHAQKYFIRMTSTDKKRRHSLFDIPFKESTPQTSPVSPIDKAAEVSQQDGTTLVAPLKSINEIQGQASTLILGGASEKPPLSPMARTHVPNICHMPYMVGVPGQSFTTAMVMPRELFPMMNYPNPDYIYLPSSNGNFASCAPFMNQKSSSLCFGPFPQAGPTTSAARSFATCAPFPNQTSHGPVTSDGKKDGLEASIGALSL